MYIFILCQVKSSPVEDSGPKNKFANYSVYDPTKTIIYAKIIWETEFIKDRMDEAGRKYSSCRAQGNSDKVIGVMISHSGVVYKILRKYIIYY